MTAKSRAALTTEIATNLADNNTSAITPALERQVCQDSVDSAFNTITDTLTGDVTTTSGSLATTLATVNTNVGTFGSATVVPVVTVNAKGLVTAVTTATITGGSGTPGGSTTQVQYNNAGAFAGDPTLTFASAVLSSPSHVITSAVSTALVVGANGTTNPALQVDASAASAATGFKVTANAAASGANLTVLSSGTVENMNLYAKGATALIGLGANGTIRYASRDYSHTFTAGVLTTAATPRFLWTGAADLTLTASTEAPSVYFNNGQIRQHATGALALQRDFRVTGSTHSFVAASTITDAASFSVDAPPTAGTNATITNAHGLYIPSSAFIGVVTTASSLTVNAPTGGGTNNYAAQFIGGATNINSALIHKRQAVADTAYTVLTTDYMVAYTSLTATRAVTLPSAAVVPNQFFIIKDEAGTAGTNNLTFAASIDGATGTTINANYGVKRVYSNGTAYFSW